jgi:hypothetical protein
MNNEFKGVVRLIQIEKELLLKHSIEEGHDQEEE